MTKDSSIAATISEIDRITLHLGWVAHRQLAQRLKPLGLTGSQFMIMRAIREYGRACTMSEIAAASLQVSASVTGIIDRLEARELVQRELNPDDRRSWRVRLTEAGLEILDDYNQQKRARLGRFLQQISPQARQEMLQMMRAYVDAMTAELDG